MGQLELSNISVEGWIIDLMFMASLMVLVRFCDSLPTMEIVHTDKVTCDVAMVINDRRCLETFL